MRALAPVATTLPVAQQRTGSEPFHQHHVADSSLLADGPCGRIGIGVIPSSRSGHGIELQYHQPARLPCALEDFETPSPHAVAATSRGDGCCRELAIELEPFRVFDFNVDNQKRRHSSMLSRKQGHMTPFFGEAKTDTYRPRIRLHGIETNASGWHSGATPYAAPPLGKGNPDGAQCPTAIANVRCSSKIYHAHHEPPWLLAFQGRVLKNLAVTHRPTPNPLRRPLALAYEGLATRRGREFDPDRTRLCDHRAHLERCAHLPRLGKRRIGRTTHRQNSHAIQLCPWPHRGGLRRTRSILERSTPPGQREPAGRSSAPLAWISGTVRTLTTLQKSTVVTNVSWHAPTAASRGP